MNETRSERVKRLAEIHARARVKNGKSQEYMALELGVSKKTVQNWEKGVSSPSFFQSLEWFRVLSLNPFPHYISYMFPNEFETLSSSGSNEDVDRAYDTLLNQVPIQGKRAMIFLYFGAHGSSPDAILQLILAHLHTPLKDRVAQAVLIKNLYEMEKELNSIICPENILPDMEVLNKAIENARISAMQHEYGYSSVKKESID